MEKTKLIEALFEDPTKDFLNHLSINGNERIIFSGRFGIGKTTFLRDHFFTESRLKDYNVFHIFPVNYSVAQNKDIFSYLKYDILLEMLKQGVSISSIDLTFVETLPFFLKENANEVIATLLKMVPLVGKDLAENYSAITELYKKLKEYTSKKAFEASADRQLHEFIQQIELSEGSIYEENVITRIIENELVKLKEGKKENVLIIDDLDRIDPEHIFRILNVFAAHFDRSDPRQSVNKFGFDKIVLVCDIANIRQIFRAKFGTNVDFNGYIDKFYSSHIFEFNPYKPLSEIVRDRVFDIKVDTTRSNNQLWYWMRDCEMLYAILDWLVSNREIDLRNVLKLKNFLIPQEWSFSIGNRSIDDNSSQIIWAFKVLCLLKGDHLSFIEAISRSLDWQKKWKRELLASHALSLVYILTFAEHDPKSELLRIGYAINNTLYRLGRHDTGELYLVEIVNGSQADIQNPGKLLQALIIETISFLKREQIL